jgi:antibiotic biosynthesis monooxygenase (ABM) superfamily enzyme
MSSTLAEDPRVPFEIRDPRVSTVVVQRVPEDRRQTFLECQHGLTRAAEAFPGYRGTELYPPQDGRPPEWVSVIHFNDQESLQHWLDSPVRAEWIRRLHAEIGDFRLKTLPSGFGAWFAGVVMGPEGQPPPSWKMAMTVLLGLYPTVMLIALLVGPYLNSLGKAASILIGNALSVALLQWVVMPPLTGALGPWLRANAPDKRVHAIGGAVLIALLLAAFVAGFRLVEDRP